MTRTRVKGVGTKLGLGLSIPKDEPNFYEMKPVHTCNSNAAVHAHTTDSDTAPAASGYRTTNDYHTMMDNQMMIRGGGSSVNSASLFPIES